MQEKSTKRGIYFMELLNHSLAYPIISLIFGILILIFPRLLNFIVAIYLIIVGLIGLLGYFKG